MESYGLPDALEVVHDCYMQGGFTTRSDYARMNAEAVAAAALMGFITTEVPGRGYGTIWRASALGLDALAIEGGTPSSLYSHGGMPSALLQSLEGTSREPAVSHLHH